MKETLNYLGNFGRYQAFLLFYLSVPGLFSGAQVLVFTWTGFLPKTRCCIPPIDGKECTEANFNTIEQLNLTGMFVANNQCFRCNYTGSSEQKCLREHSTNCRGLGTVYDTNHSEIHNSLAVDLDLGCDNVWKHELVWSAFTVGMMIGSGVSSSLSDRFGRRPVALVSGVACLLTSFGAVFAANYYAYIILQVAIGLFETSLFFSTYIIIMELMGGWARNFAGIWLQTTFSIGVLYDALFAWLFRDWRYVQLLAAVPILLCIPYYWLLPESIRWLTVNRKHEQARFYIQRAARANRVTVPDDVIERELNNVEHTTDQKYTVLSLFTHWRLAKNTSIVWFTWLAAAMSYYGLAQNTGDLGGNVFVTNVLSAIGDVIGLLLCLPMMEYIGRRISLVILFLLGGVLCILSGLLTNGTATVATAVFGRMFISGAFAMITYYSAEVFPTVVRQSGTGYASSVARIGSLLAPQIHLLVFESVFSCFCLYSFLAVTETRWNLYCLPYATIYAVPSSSIIAYGAVALIAGVLDVFLPETKGVPLPETLQDGINLGNANFSRQDSFKKREPKAESINVNESNGDYGSLDHEQRF